MKQFWRNFKPLASISDSMGYTASGPVEPLQLPMQVYRIVCLSDMGAGAAKMLKTGMSKIHLPADFKSQRPLGCSDWYLC